MIKLGYDSLFSIHLLHDYYGGACFDISIVPTKDCEDELKNYGLLFKTLPDGCVILFSKNDKEEIQKNIDKLVRFRFLLVLRNLLFENFTALPYPKNKLGKKIYYFSNSSNAGIVDAVTTLAKSAGNKLGDKDCVWLVNPILSIPLGGNFTQVDLNQVTPGLGKKLIKSFPTTALQNLTVNLAEINNPPDPPFQLQAGNYTLDFVGLAPKTESFYFDESLSGANCWGILEIVKTSGVDYTAKTDYTLTCKANPWSYYLIDTANKILVNNDDFANLSITTTGLSGLAFSWVKEADIEANTYEERRYALLKKSNAGKPIFLLRSNQSMHRSAESTVRVKLILDNIQRSLPSPVASQSKPDSIQIL